MSYGGLQDDMIDREAHRHSDVFPNMESLNDAGYYFQQDNLPRRHSALFFPVFQTFGKRAPQCLVPNSCPLLTGFHDPKQDHFLIAQEPFRHSSSDKSPSFARLHFFLAFQTMHPIQPVELNIGFRLLRL
jgi:hypothetical protein